ncbi:hypothetical protein AVEN_108964-1 [Araneus ventricosus]|uniref:Tc1-like transposase DDE domain-containing protein n=1 Tax=Araneus ventricosus TaxID=182803 RepID=A0A4Y2F5Z2_ARAVE|nr:hypothetical protein AVEN_108964-1 [Araneus ventricosus]
MSIVHSDCLGQFQQDNATPHATRVAAKWLQGHSSDFRQFHWPPKSPEMKIIEDMWNALLHAVEKRSPPPLTPMDLLTALQDSWCEFPPGYLQTPVESMPRRFASLLRAPGGPTRYYEVVPDFWLFSNRKVILNTCEGSAIRDRKQGCPQGSCSVPALWNLVANEILQEN